MLIKDILNQKGRDVFTIHAGATLVDAAAAMKERNVGALLVKDEDSFTGIISERDLVTVMATKWNELNDLRVSHVMVPSEHLIVAEPDDESRYVMAVMIQKRIRHLPVVEEGRIVGLVSIRDVVRANVMKLDARAHFLSDYIRP